MSKCKKCGVLIGDKSQVCPLCHMVLTMEEGENSSKKYPNITKKRKMWTRLWKLATFILIVVQCILVALNVLFYRGIRWSLISGVVILYLLVSLYQMILHPDSPIRKLFWQTVFVCFLLVGIDVALGFRGWSLSIGMPCVILSLDTIVLVCMIIQFRNWQNYLLLQMFALIISIFCVGTWYLRHQSYGVLAWITFGVTAFFFAFCVFFGSTKAKNELQRRFYI